MIYFWNDTKLARDLKTGALSEKAKVGYLIAVMVLAALLALFGAAMQDLATHLHEVAHPDAISPVHFTPPAGSHTGPVLLRVAGYVLIVALIYFLYRTNLKGDGLHTLERYICLSFTCLLRTVILLIPVSFAVGFLIGILSKFVTYNISVFVPLIILALFAVYYTYRMYRGFKIASGQME